MGKTYMTTERVLELIAAYGAEPNGWPEDEREAAVSLMRAEPEVFAVALEDARALDAALELERIPEPSAALADAILRAAPRPIEVARRRKWLSGLLPSTLRLPFGATMASLCVGLVAGYAQAGQVGFETYLGGDTSYSTDWDGSFDEWLNETEEEA